MATETNFKLNNVTRYGTCVHEDGQSSLCKLTVYSRNLPNNSEIHCCSYFSDGVNCKLLARVTVQGKTIFTAFV